MQRPLVERLKHGPLLADGAMGSMLHSLGVSYERSFDELNLSNPALVQQVHRQYIEAGAELIETNTFSANRYKLAHYGLEGRVRAINLQGARIAREARDVAGEPVLVAGAVGPTGLLLRLGSPASAADIRASFREQIEALLEGGVDAIMLETFTDLAEIALAIEAARESCDLPLIAQMTFSDESRTLAGQSAEEVATTLDNLGADVVGVNCSVGPQATMEIVQKMRPQTARPLSALPNAGLPRLVEGRFLYFSTPQYFAQYAREFVAAGVSIVGGCCGTTPEHIRAMCQALQQVRPAATPVAPQREVHWVQEAPEREAPPTGLASRLARGEFVVSVELDPPKGLNPARVLAGAAMLRDMGADLVNVGDSPMARVRMSSLATAALIQQQAGLETLIHFTTRDRNLMALQGDLLGAHALGVRNVLALTGDPPRVGDYPHATGVWDVDSIGLVSILARLNEGRDWAGTPIGRSASFFIGCAINPSAEDLEQEVERFRRKVAAGAHFAMTQPFYDVELWTAFLRKAGPLSVPVLVGVLPLQSYKHAEFLHNEVPGITIPQEVRERMRRAGERGTEEGLAIARELLAALRDRCAGVYLMPSFGRYEVVGELVKELKSG